MGSLRTSKAFYARALHQCAAIGVEPVVLNPEEVLSNYGSKLTPQQACKIITDQKDYTQAFNFFDWARHQRGYKHNGAVYGAIVHSLCAGKRFDLLEKVLMHLRSEKFGLRAPTFAFILKSMGQEGKIQETLRMFYRMPEFRCEPTLSTYRCILCVLVEAGFLDEVLTIFQEMLHAKVIPDNLTLGMLTNIFCKKGRLDDALMIAKAALESVDALTLNGLVRSLCQAVRPHDAITLIESSKTFGTLPDSKTYGKLIRSLCRIGKVDEAIIIMDKINEESLTPDVMTFNAILGQLCMCVRVDEAYQLFERLPIEPDAVSFQIIIHGFCKKRMVDEAQKLVSDMVNRGFLPTVEMYGWISKRLISLGRVEEVCHLLLSLERKGLVLDRSFLNGIIQAMSSAGYLDVAQRLLKGRSATGFSPNKDTCVAIINGFCKERKFLEAVTFILNNVVVSGCMGEIDDWSPLFQGLCEEGHLNETMKLYETLLDQECVISKLTRRIILRGLSKTGRITDVTRIINDMHRNKISIDKQTYESLVDCKFKDNLEGAELFSPLIGSNIVLSKKKYTMLIDRLLESGAVEFAITIFDEMRRNGCPPSTHIYSALISGLCNLNNLVEARQFIQRMEEDGCGGDIAVYTMLLRKYWKRGQCDDADSLYQEMRKNGRLPDAATYNVLLEWFSEMNRIQELLQLLDEMRVHGCPPKEVVLSTLVKNLDSRHKKKVEKSVKELFGIILTSETSNNQDVVAEGKKSSLPFLDSFSR